MVNVEQKQDAESCWQVSIDPFGGTTYLTFPEINLMFTLDRAKLHELNVDLLRAEHMIDFLKANPNAGY